MWLAVLSRVYESRVMDCLGRLLISGKAVFKKRAVAAGPKSSWVESWEYTSKELCHTSGSSHMLFTWSIWRCEKDLCSHLTAPGKLDGVG